jgi:hypothetical protein
MASLIQNITVDCADPFTLAQFWSAVLNLPVDPENEAGDDEVGIPLDEHGRELLFIKVPEPKTVKNRLHLCLEPLQPREVEVERLAGSRSLTDGRPSQP